MSHQDTTLSIIVPVLNEADNIAPLLSRIHATMNAANISYEVVFIDDYSDDSTVDQITRRAGLYPVSVHTKVGRRGKAYSLLQGFKLAKGEIFCMIDADLQYPPEAIPEMVSLITNTNADVVLSRRTGNGTSLLRRISTKTYNLVFARMLLGLNYDTQAGLKTFRRHVADNITLNPSQWSFDMEFVVRCLQNGYAIFNYDITCESRYSGEGKVNFVPAAIELARAALKVRSTVSRKQIKAAYRENVRQELATLGRVK